MIPPNPMMPQPQPGAANQQARHPMLRQLMAQRLMQALQSGLLDPNANRGIGNLTQNILNRPMGSVMGGAIAPQAGGVAAAPMTATGGLYAQAPAPTAPAPTYTLASTMGTGAYGGIPNVSTTTTAPTAGAANQGAITSAPAPTSDVTQTGEGGQTIASTGSLAWAPGRVRR